MKSNKITYEVSKEQLDKCNEMIVLARTNMIMTCPFFGILAAQLKLVPNNTWCRTMAVDGKHLYYNVEFIIGISDPLKRDAYRKDLIDRIEDITESQINDALNPLSMQNLIAAICHEILHCAYGHFLRKGTRDNNKWNKAADYAINQIIKRDKIGEIQDSWLYDKKYEGKTAEEIYNILVQDDETGNGKPSGGTLDQHNIVFSENESHDNDNDNVNNDVPNFSQEELEKFMESFKDIMIGAAMANGAPKEIREMVQEYKEPKIDWRSKLNRTIRSFIKNDVTYSNPSRRSWINGIGYGIPLFPGMKPDMDIDICIAIDASGSISTNMLLDFLSEVYGITKQFSQFKIKLLTFDTMVYEVQDYTVGQEQEILNYPVTGGGGTDFDAVWDYMKSIDYHPKQLVMFTDGIPYKSWGDKDYCETLFIIHSNPKIESPFGVSIHYDFNEKIKSTK